MSDNWLRYVPSDPQYQPAATAVERAQTLLRSFLPNAEDISAHFFAHPTFIDAGANWSGVTCPSCGADAEPWWGEAVSAAAEHDFSSLAAVASCCGAGISLNDLQYVWPAAFGRFVLDAMNPNVERLSPAQLEQLGSAVGCPVREVLQHL